MNINCTVIIQICNFFLAWTIVERILLRTVLEKLNFKKKTESDFLNSIEKEKQEIAILEHSQRDRWQSFNKYCLHNMPSFLKKTDISSIVLTDMVSDEANTKEIDALSEKYAIRIMQWLKEAR